MKPGTRARITTSTGLVFEGVLLDGKEYTLKLDDGYNVGIDPRNVKDAQELAAETHPQTAIKKASKTTGLPEITLLHTGGTIASKVDYVTGGVSNKITPDELLALYPELTQIANITPQFLSQMSSDDMRFAHYNELITAVESAVKNKAQGIIITHGTDTLHYTAAALHYALLGVPVPVVLVGSQRSADRGSSDAKTNLVGAARFITELKTPGVFIAMHGSSNDDDIIILRGINARKNHSSRRDAFKAINSNPVARITDKTQLIQAPPKSDEKFSPKRYNTDLRIGMVYMHPQFFPDALSPYATYDGLIVLGTGLGHAPINAIDEHTKLHEQTKQALLTLAKKVPVVMSTQCLNGRVNLQVYSPGRVLQEAGVLGHDLALSPETLFAKLAFLLSHHKKDVATLLSTDFSDDIPRVEEGVYE